MRNRMCEDGTLEVFLEGRVDSGNADAFSDELAALLEKTGAVRLTLNCAGLAYVSSAGLRVFMRLAKQLEALRVDEVSSEVYEIFDVTGLAQILDVRKALREVDVSGLELLGEGANGSVYRLTPDEMIKVFRPGLTLDDIESEREASRHAFLLGVPCAIPFDTVRCGERYGTIYELLNAVTLSERIAADPSTLEDCAVQSAKMFKSLHAIEVPKDTLLDAKRSYYGRLSRISDSFVPDENKQLRHLLDVIPPADRFVHNDYHPKNVMYSNGELMIIDLGDAGSGNPLLDWIHSYLVFNLMGAAIRERADDEMSFVGITYGELRRYWAIFTETYLGSAERATRMSALLEPWGWLVYLSASMCHPRLPKEYHPKYANLIREKVLAHYEEMIASVDEMDGLLAL